MSPLRRIVVLAVFTLALLSWLGCARDGAPGTATAEVAGVPQRIVSMTPALTEILFSLGLGERVVGVTDYCDYPPEALEKTRIGGFSNPSVEAILALEPDLVLVSPNVGNREAALEVRRVGGPLVVVPAENLDDTFEAIEQIAHLSGVEERGDKLIRSMRQRIDEATERVWALPPVNVLFCLQLDPIIAVGRGTLPAEILELAGGRNVLNAEGYPRLGIETVIERAPAVILQARMDTPEPNAERRALKFWQRWPSIPAVREERVHVFDGTTALRPGPRVAEAVERLSRLLHPDPAPVSDSENPRESP